MKTNNKANTIGSIVCILLAGLALTQLYYVWGTIAFLLLMGIAWYSITAAAKSDMIHIMAKKALAREKKGLLTDQSEVTHEVTTILKIKTKGTKILSVDSVDLESKSEDNQK